MPSSTARSPPPADGSASRGASRRVERGLIAGAAEPLRLDPGTVLFRPGMPIEHVVFPESGLVSLSVEMPGSTGAEVGMVGREGMVGLQSLLGEPTALVRAVVQAPGNAYRVAVAPLLSLADGSRNLRGLVRRYSMAALLHASFCAACNVAHPLDRRIPRWLLAAQDRVGSGFPITQEDLAVLLGARRQTVNSVLQTLKAAGLIRFTRGWVAVANRAELESAACPCYGAERRALERLLSRPWAAEPGTAAPMSAS